MSQKTHIEVLSKIQLLLHPIMPFITEEIFQSLAKQDKSIMVTDFPKFDETKIDLEADMKIQKVIDIITAVRNIRSIMNIKPADTVDVVFKPSEEDADKIVSENEPFIKTLAKINNISFSSAKKRPEFSASAVVGNLEIFVQLFGKIDFEKEKERLESQLINIKEELSKHEVKISNPKFIEHADPEEVERVKQKHLDAQNKKTKIEEIIKTLAKQD